MMAARHPQELERDDVSHDGSDDGSDISDKKKADQCFTISKSKLTQRLFTI